MFWTVIALFEVLGLVTAVHAVMSVRTPQGSIAWVAALVTIAPVSVPAYWVFGRNKFHGYVLARQQDLGYLDNVIREANAGIPRELTATPAQLASLRGAERMARLPATRGNAAELLIDGEATFRSIFEGIDQARDYALVQFYIVKDDELGRELKARMIERAGAGVRVLFLYDEIGSLGLPDSYTRELREAGVQVSPFHSRKGFGNRFQLNFRNHRKTVVTDGKVAWIGGHNVGDEYMGRDPKFGAWRDTHVRIEGPAVLGAQLAFIEDWRWATDETPEELRWTPHVAADGESHALVIASGPADRVETASLMFTQAINQASSRIWIASPYFVPDDATIQALQLAAMRGVDVRILIPEKTDNVLVTLAAYSYFEDIKDVGVQVYRYGDGFLHGKYVLIDEVVSLIGTANFDNRSFRLNFEITAAVIDREFAKEVEAMFETDFARSRLMQAGEYRDKPAWFRFAVRLSRLAAPVL
jgi:cardiolipin synthase